MSERRTTSATGGEKGVKDERTDLVPPYPVLVVRIPREAIEGVSEDGHGVHIRGRRSDSVGLHHLGVEIERRPQELDSWGCFCVLTLLI